MGVCIAKLPHSCGTKRGLQVFADEETGKVDGYCFACGTPVRNPYGEELTVEDVELPAPKTEKEIQQELAEVSGYPSVDVPSRKLRGEDLERFGVKTALSEEDGKTPTTMYFPMKKDGKLRGYYVKTLSKPSHTWSIGDVKDADPFGWEEAMASGAYKLIITEGLEDAITVDKLFRKFTKEGKEDFIPAVISLTNGVQSVKKNFNDRAADIKRSFREIVLCYDNDEQGQKALEATMLYLPKAKQVILPEKDANDCLVKGKQKAAYKALCFNAETPKNTRIVLAEDLHEAARTPTEYGPLHWPFPTLNKLLRNVRYGETVYIGAGVKMGKSELLNQIAAHFIKEDGVPVFMAKPEEANKKTYKLMCNKIAGKVFHDPDVEFDFDAYDEAGKILEGKLMMVDLYQHLGWESLKKDIIIAANMGAKAIFIDPITNLTNGMQASEAYTALGEIAQDLSSMAHDLDVVIFIFCHLKEPEGNLSKDARAKKYKEGKYVGLGNCPHEMGGDVLSSQFAGSRAMMRSCNLMLGLEGNKDPDLDAKIRRMRWLSILEDREFGNQERIPLYWNPSTTLYKELS